jgi:putative transposase
MAAISLMMSRVILNELRSLEARQRKAEAAADTGESASLFPRRRCSPAVERQAHLIQLYLMVELGYELPDLDELLLWASRNPNPHRQRLRSQVESGKSTFARH